MAAAEEILAREGVAGGSMAGILRAAGQRNEAAVTYHFGSREGLAMAIIESRRHPISSIRQELLTAATADGALPTLRDSLEVLVHPAALALESHEGRNYLRILADVFRRQSVADRLRPRASDVRQTIRLIEARLVHLPEDLVTERVAFVVSAMVEALGLRATDLEGQSEPYLESAVWECNLILVLEAALSAPPVARAASIVADSARPDRDGSPPLRHPDADVSSPHAPPTNARS